MIQLPFFNYDSGTESISSRLLLNTENAVFTDDGRYFVIGKHTNIDLGWGIYEVVKTESGYDVKQIVPGILKVDSNSYPCNFRGLTTDGKYLYASSAVNLEGDPTKIDFGALFRVLPGKDTVDVSIAHYQQDELHGYNGMAVDSVGFIYMSNTFALTDRSLVAVYKVEVIEQNNFEIKISPWLYVNLLRDIAPNGIQIRDNIMYYVSGKGLYKINIMPSGPGISIPLYMRILGNHNLLIN